MDVVTEIVLFLLAWTDPLVKTKEWKGTMGFGK